MGMGNPAVVKLEPEFTPVLLREVGRRIAPLSLSGREDLPLIKLFGMHQLSGMAIQNLENLVRVVYSQVLYIMEGPKVLPIMHIIGVWFPQLRLQPGKRSSVGCPVGCRKLLSPFLRPPDSS